ncbi:bZIP transcription factor protein [Rutstroemia sp. NJR-2017a WRK4]|nr:bZIP transcription factor protein [Rutstroemia sp. NJR-2017a WRK4]
MSTPNLKYEQSPAESLAESFTSTPGVQYPPLFPPSMEPHQAMTPQSFDDDSMFGGSMNGSIAGTPAPEKKPVKKRKSWGQQLPEPKTNLPPRKRAKTEDEKEQRRVERVLRNRRAAQSSRERKRQEVEALESEKRMIERKNHDLELQLADMAAKYQMAVKQLEQVTGGNLPPAFRSSVTSPSNPVEQSHATSPSLTRGLFASEQDSIRPMMTPQAIRDTHNNMQSAMGTVDPASLSPPPMDSTEEAESNASSFDMTQHPAEVLCDLQCQSKEQRPWMASAQPNSVITRVLATTLWIQMCLSAISTILTPMEQIFNSLKTGSSLLPTPSIITLIIWLATTSAPLTISSNSTISFTKTKSHSLRPKFSLRIRLLRRLLACSPNLARPLMDATSEAMRLLSEQKLVRDCLSSAGECDLRDGDKSPSIESLMTLLWAIKVIEKEQALPTPKPDAVMEGAGQACDELKNLFGLREVSGASSTVSFALASSEVGGIAGEKSWEARRMAFMEDGKSS